MDQDQEYADEAANIPDVPEPQVAQPEAGFSLNWSMVDDRGANVQVTMRGEFAHDWNKVLGSRNAFLSYVTGWPSSAGGWKFGTAAAASVATGAPPAAQAQTPAAAGRPPIAAPSAVPATPVKPVGPIAAATGKEILTIKVARMQVEPRPDGKVGLKFYIPGHNFPDIQYTGTVANAVQLLAPHADWTEEHLSKVEDYTVDMTIRYTLGKPNSKGNPYKDILNVA